MTGFSLRLWNGNLCKNPRAVEKPGRITSGPAAGNEA